MLCDEEKFHKLHEINSAEFHDGINEGTLARKLIARVLDDKIICRKIVVVKLWVVSKHAWSLSIIND